MQVAFVSTFVLCWVLLSGDRCEAKVFTQCEFVRTIQGSFPASQISTWTCIAYHESRYDTNALNSNTGDHGIFQINEKYWCSTSSTPGGGCSKRCSDFQNDDISDDIACVKTIYAETERISGDGFTAWTVYKNNCKGDTSSWVAGC